MGKHSIYYPGLWFVGLLLVLGRIVLGGENVWDITSLELLDGEGFKKVILPIAHMADNVYRYPDVVEIEGWTMVDAVNPVDGGMHCLLYKEDSNTGKMILAFKGTTIGDGSKLSSADICADDILWGPIPVLSEQDCSVFSSETLDYYQQALNYTKKILKTYPDASILLTGHSLGAGLAVLMAATFDTKPLFPVVGFSAAGSKGALKMLKLALTEDHHKQLYIVADKWDEIMRTSWAKQEGTLCLYQNPISEDCRECFGDGETPTYAESAPTLDVANLQLPADGIIDCGPEGEAFGGQHAEGASALVSSNLQQCLTCFAATHNMRNVIRLAEMGDKPVCKFQALFPKQPDTADK